MIWHLPLPMKFILTDDGMSFLTMGKDMTGVPLSPHPGSYAYVRKNHVHEGVDLYCPEGTPVYAVEDGTIVARVPFTGSAVGSLWWEDTYALLVEGKSGVVVYGEIMPSFHALGGQIFAGDPVGDVTRVLKKDKGRPRSMLHLELHTHGTRGVFDWRLGPGGDPWKTKPPSLRDPTPLLREAVKARFNL